MDPNFKDLLSWQEMSKKVKDLQETQAVIKAYFAEGPSKQLHDLQHKLDLQWDLLGNLGRKVEDTDAMLQRGIDRLDRNQESIWSAINDLQERVRRLEEYNLQLAYPTDSPLRFQEADCYPLYYRKIKEDSEHTAPTDSPKQS